MVDALREAVEAEFVVENTGWAFERVTRVTEQLQRDVPADERFETIVLWSDEHTAFTTPGRTIYFTRRLLERMPDDDAAAFVIAHELAHHRLGHVPPLGSAFAYLPIRFAISLLSRWIAGAQHETDADLLAIEMCLDAGYDVEKCLHALEQCAIVQLDYGDVDGAIGAEDGKPQGGYAATAHRIAAARIHAGRLRQYGYRLQIDLEERRKARRRRIAIAAGAAAAGVALLLIRRR